jgi:cell division protein FtsB
MPEKTSGPQHVKRARRLSPVKIVLVLAAILIAWLMIYFPDYARLNALRQANKKLTGDIEVLQKEIAQLKSNIARAGYDPLIYEKVAREELGAVRSDEIVVDIEE